MKKFVRGIVILCLVLAVSANLAVAAPESQQKFIYSNGVYLQTVPTKLEGKITLAGKTSRALLKILVLKDETQRWYDVELEDGVFNEEIWFIDGTGEYQVSVLVHKDGRVYSFGPTVFIENTTEVNRFLVPTLHVESNSEEVMTLAEEITKDSKTDIEKAKKIYDWVATNITYDYGKYIMQLNNNYDNDYGALKTLGTLTGVCYDYSTLLAALGRAAGLQVKVVKGYYRSPLRSELHAWNEIYISEQDRWINVDSTFGSSALEKSSYFDSYNFYTNHEKLEEY
ncbi:MAG: transglutaminase domain-containing protein [Clostridium sp.]|nr:transglutaminase domain-containing protein [Clostridium sp.]